MKYEVGKSYRDINGNRIEIISIKHCANLDHPVVGWLYPKNGGIVELQMYTKEGSFFSGAGSSRDLIEEWKEPEFEITEVGDYICRDGRKVVVLHILPDSFIFPIKGYTEDTSHNMVWLKNGRFTSDAERDLDIVRKVG